MFLAADLLTRVVALRLGLLAASVVGTGGAAGVRWARRRFCGRAAAQRGRARQVLVLACAGAAAGADLGCG